MKKLLITCLCTVSCLVALAEESTNATKSAEVSQSKKGKKNRPKLTKEQRRERFMSFFGGYVIQPGTGKGKIALVDCESGYPNEEFESIKDTLTEHFLVRIDIIRKSGLDLTNADAFLNESGAGAAVIVAKLDAKLPTLLAAPDNRWAFVNVSALPENDKILMRREAVRALAFSVGGALSQAPVSLMGPFGNLKQLASLPTDQMPIDVVQRVATGLKYYGVHPYVRDVYLHGCEQGWAPPPTNEYQKAVWERVKAQREAKPSNPITIKPGQKPLSK